MSGNAALCPFLEAISHHTCVLQMKTCSGDAHVRLKGEVQVVGRGVQQGRYGGPWRKSEIIFALHNGCTVKDCDARPCGCQSTLSWLSVVLSSR